MQQLITIIIPVYNVEPYLARCLDSVLQQTYTALEIILVDDGSTDSCGRLCDAYAEKDSRIKVIHKVNGGLSSARNAGLDAMSGDYVLFVDSDDYIAPDCVTYLYDLIVNTDAQIAIGNYETTSNGHYAFKQGQASVEVISGKEAIVRQFGKRTVQYVSACAKLYNGKLFDRLRFPEGLLHEDEGTTYKALYGCKGVAVSQKVIYAYYFNPASITKRPKKKNYQDLCTVLGEQIQFYHEHGETVLEVRVRNRYCIQAADHYLPKGFYGEPKSIIRTAKAMYRGVWKTRDIPLIERGKGFMSAYLCAISAWLMKNRKKGVQA